MCDVSSNCAQMGHCAEMCPVITHRWVIVIDPREDPGTRSSQKSAQVCGLDVDSHCTRSCPPCALASLSPVLPPDFAVPSLAPTGRLSPTESPATASRQFCDPVSRSDINTHTDAEVSRVRERPGRWDEDFPSHCSQDQHVRAQENPGDRRGSSGQSS